MRAFLLVASRFALFALATCQTAGPKELPAIIVHPTSESRASLAQAVSAALNGAPVTLSPDALTKVSTLSIERVHRRDERGLPLQGRELRPSERFHLVRSNARCVLIHEGSPRRFVLENTACSPL